MDEEEFDVESTNRKFVPLDLVGIAAAFVSDIAQSTADAFEAFGVVMKLHANYQRYQTDFHQEAAIDIEKITGEQDG